MTTVSLTITRTELSLTTLDISASPFGLPDGSANDPDFGIVTWRRDLARSPYLHGAQLLGKVKDLVEGCTLDIDVTGADQAAIKTNVTTLVNAFSQFSYVLTLTLDASTWAWTCQPADYRIDPAKGSNVYGLLCSTRFVFARQPVASSGPY